MVIVSGSFDDLKSRQIRFLEEAAKLGPVRVHLWSDAAVRQQTGRPPKFPQPERHYLLEAIRFVHRLALSRETIDPEALPGAPAPAGEKRADKPDLWVVEAAADSPAKRRFCQDHGLDYRVLGDADLAGFPAPPAPRSLRKKVIVTGCYDWFHSGHVRFFEECSALGDLYVVVGHDANIRLLKGAGHPLVKQEERRYVAGSVRFVTQALISTGHGWLDAEPEIQALQPDIYAVNQDGDKPEKREYCARHRIEYVVLKRVPKTGLPRRQSTDLRGF